MATEPEQSILDLTARTATADSDLLHINSGGTDYKEQKVDFLHGDLGRLFDNTTSLIGQAEALPTDGTYFGRILGYGHQSETGLPINAHCYVKVTKSSSSTVFVEIWSTADAEGGHYSITKTSNVWGSWVKIPTRAEITSLNNSLTTLSNKFTYRDYSVTTGTSLYSSFYYGGVNIDTSLGAIVGIVITSTTSNQAAFASIVSNTGVRVFSPISGLTAGVRIFFMSS